MSNYSVSIHKYGDKYRVDYSYISPDTGKRCRTCKRGFNFKREANVWVAEELPKLIQKLEKEEISDEDMTMDELIEEYMEDFRLWHRDTSYDTKENIVRTKIVPFFSGKKVFAITNNDIRQWHNYLKTSKTKNDKPFSETYLRTISNQLSAIFAYAVEYHNLPTNPIQNVKRIGKKKAPEADFWRYDEYEKFSKAIQDTPVAYYAFQIFFWCGLRQGELLALTPKTVDVKNRIIKVMYSYHRKNGNDVFGDTKTLHSERDVVIPEFLAEELKEYMSGIYGLTNDTRLFPLSKSQLYRIMEKGCEKSGVKRIKIHGLRHSHLTFLKKVIGANMEEVAKRAGHSSSEISKLYVHQYGDEGMKLANNLDVFMEARKNVSKE